MHSAIQNASPRVTLANIPREITDFARQVAELFLPQKIILFGSFARGTAGPDSDVDLLVVMPHEGHPALQAAEIIKRVRKTFPMDLMVRSPEKVKQRLEWGDPFLTEILEEGVVLYESDHS